MENEVKVEEIETNEEEKTKKRQNDRGGGVCQKQQVHKESRAGRNKGRKSTLWGLGSAGRSPPTTMFCVYYDVRSTGRRERVLSLNGHLGTVYDSRGSPSFPFWGTTRVTLAKHQTVERPKGEGGTKCLRCDQLTNKKGIKKALERH